LKSKKVISIFGVLLVTVLSLVGCSQPPATTTATNPYSQIQTEISALQTDMTAVKVAIF